MKNLSVKKLVGIGVGAAAALAVVALAAVFALRVDSAEARQIALDAAGGGEVVAHEVSSEGLWNEYSYEIVNGDMTSRSAASAPSPRWRAAPACTAIDCRHGFWYHGPIRPAAPEKTGGS